VVLNCIAFWNTLAIQQIAEKLRDEGYAISQEELSHITPTMTHHIGMIGKFDINLTEVCKAFSVIPDAEYSASNRFPASKTLEFASSQALVYNPINIRKIETEI
jgi:hypothetical protein